MISKSNPLALLILVFLLAACGVPEVSTPAPTPQAIQVFYPDSLKPYADKLAACAAGNPLVALYFLPPPAQPDSLAAGDLLLSLGNPDVSVTSYYLSQVGTERIIVVANQQNQITQLSIDTLRSMYSGGITRWETGSGKPLQVWILPAEDAVRRAFDSAVLSGLTPTTHAMLAPSPIAMLEEVAKNESAVGYLPESVLTASDSLLADKVRILPLSPEIETILTLPIIAITQDEPLGLPRDLLVCLQSSTP